MKIVIIGGTGLIGRQLAPTLKSRGHDIVVASPSTGVDSVTGKGLPEALRGANVLIDVTNSPSFADDAVMTFFRSSTENLVSAAKAAGISHFVVLSIVGIERIQDSGYMRAKHAQEQIIRESNIPYTIVRATQFFEFLNTIADVLTKGNSVHVPTAPFQPIAADDVVDVLARIATSEPKDGIVDLAGPEAMNMAKFIQTFLSARNDSRQVIPDAEAKYFGAVLNKDGLAPTANYISGQTRFADWMTSH